MNNSKYTKIALILAQSLMVSLPAAASDYDADRAMMSDNRSNLTGTSIKDQGKTSTQQTSGQTVQNTQSAQAQTAAPAQPASQTAAQNAAAVPQITAEQQTLNQALQQSQPQYTQQPVQQQAAPQYPQQTASQYPQLNMQQVQQSPNVTPAPDPVSVQPLVQQQQQQPQTAQSYAGSNANRGVLDALFKQAQTWHDRFQPQLAKESLNRILLTDPNNTEAMYLMSLWASEQGQAQEAKAWRDRLQRLNPNDPHLQQLTDMEEMSSLSQDQLKRARDLASSGNIPAALSAYQALFRNGVPPKSLTSEYYLTMSGDQNHYDEAVQAIANYIRQNPNDTTAKVTYGKLLTYRDSTRRDGIEVLEYFAQTNADADRALRQALMWLTPTDADQPVYMRYCTRHPEDAEVAKKFKQNLIGGMAADAFNAMNTQNSAEAKAGFEEILKRAPSNADALEGLGYLYLRDQDYEKASEYLLRASEASPVKKEKLYYDGTLAGARAALKKGDTAVALSMCDQLIAVPNYDHSDAYVLKADIYRRMKNYAEAERLLREVLKNQPDNWAANESLYYTYMDQKKVTEARALIPRMPEKLRNVIAQRERPAPVPGAAERRSAIAQANSGDTAGAIATLYNGIKKAPRNPWLRYDLAKLLRARGDTFAADSQISYLTRQGASNEELFAAATYLGEYGNSQEAMQVAGRISPSYSSGQVNKLKQRLRLRSTFDIAENYIDHGQRGAALNTLNGIGTNPAALETMDLSHLAYLYLRAGDQTTAVRLADMAMARGVRNDQSLEDFADVISVYNATGNRAKAQMLLGNSNLVSNTNPASLAGMQNGHIIAEADRLRTSGRSADAYDVLFQALQTSPNDTGLMLAMARIYQDNAMYQEASNIYDRVMQMQPQNREAIEGNINTAIAAKNGEKAAALINAIPNDGSPDTLMLRARAAESNSEYRTAVDYLKQAKSMLEGSPYIVSQSTVPAPNGSMQPTTMHAPNNPFRNERSVTKTDPQQAPNIMPWEQVVPAPIGSAPVFSYNTGAADRAQKLEEVNEMLSRLYDKTATIVRVAPEARQKNGDDGLSRVDGIRVPISISTPLASEHRFTATVTPVMMDSGSLSSSTISRYGSAPLTVGASNIVTTLNSIIGAVKTEAQTYVDNSQDIDYYSITNTVNSLYGTSLTAADIENMYNSEYLTYGYNLTTISGYNELDSVIQELTGQTLTEFASTNRSTISGQSVSGISGGGRETSVEANLGLEGEIYKVDIGAVNIGESDGTNFVGGIELTPKLDRNLSLALKLERRAMTDSVLSYYGIHDQNSGKFWGAVTKNGGSVGLNYDNGRFGAYAEGSFYYYEGDNVRDNHSVGFKTGMYTRFINTKTEQLSVGVHVEYQDFDNDQNHFTVGHGGYFSPQNYYAFALPFNYHRRIDNFDVNVGAAIGYQSYKSDGGAYFPTESSWQSTLNTLASYGVLSSTGYDSEDESGVSGNVNLRLDYNVSDFFKVGGLLNYNTFGDYEEYNEMLYFKYLMGVD